MSRPLECAPFDAEHSRPHRPSAPEPVGASWQTALAESHVPRSVSKPCRRASVMPPTHGVPRPERASYLDVSALSPREYDVLPQWAERIRPALTRREGLLDEHAAVKFLRSELGISVEDEVNILSLFERLPMGLERGHFYAMARLASWAQQGRPITKELLFTQSAYTMTRLLTQPNRPRYAAAATFHAPRAQPPRRRAARHSSKSLRSRWRPAVTSPLSRIGCASPRHRPRSIHVHAQQAQPP